MVDLSSLPEPAMISRPDAAAIISRMQTAFIAWAQDTYGVDVTGIVALEGEPLAIQMEFYAYEEAAMRSAFNDILKANLLAFAAGTDLDHIAADHGVDRLVDESDAALRERVVLKDQGSSAAGPEEWYEFYARQASTDVAAARVYKPGTGPEIAIAILSVSNGGVADQALLDAVYAAVNAVGVRGMNDVVIVEAAAQQIVNVEAEIWLLPETPSEVFNDLETILNDAWSSESGIGFDLARSWLISRLMVDGVSGVDLISPAADIIADDNSAIALGAITLTLKGRKR